MTTMLVAAAVVASLLLGVPATGAAPAGAPATTSSTDATSGNGPPG
jgi:hypothetical protein